MDFSLRRHFLRWTRSRPGEHLTDYQGLAEAPPTLEGEYQRLLYEILLRCGVPPGVVVVEVHEQRTRARKPAFIAELTLQRWDRDAVLRVLIGLPLLERAIRRDMSTLWVADVSTFAGLRLQGSPALQAAQPLRELRRVLSSVIVDDDHAADAD